ncbi:MAG: hypothetical protein ACR2MY_09395 [Candidatus Dormibacteria bacterium]
MPTADKITEAAEEAFLAGIQRLTTEQWRSVMVRASWLGDDMGKEDVIRGAVVAITVRNVLPKRHFEALYGPFSEVLPFGSLLPPQSATG